MIELSIGGLKRSLNYGIMVCTFKSPIHMTKSYIGLKVLFSGLLCFPFGVTCYAQFIDVNKMIVNPTLNVADSMLRKKQVIYPPSEALKYLNSPILFKKSDSIQLPSGKSKQVDAVNIYEQSKNAVGWVAMCYRKRISSAVTVNGASAFVVSPDGICLTNYHVVYAFANDSGLDGSGIFLVRLGNGKIYPLKKILFASVEDDVAILQLETQKGEQLPYLSLEDQIPSIGEDVYMLGNPKDMYYLMTKGMVANLYADAIAWPNGKGGSQRDLMAITADFAVGASGGPILNSKGNVIGMVSSTHVIEQNGTGYPLTQMVIKNAIPNRSLLKALAAIGLQQH